nr:MAG TPA: hypothetical protein [Caudoviricetes sp.]
MKISQLLKGISQESILSPIPQLKQKKKLK